MDQVWIRLTSKWAPKADGIGFGWALWQPSYNAASWPFDELKPGFAYYACGELQDGKRAITQKAVVEDALPPTRVDSPEAAYRLVAENLFDGKFSIRREEWHDNHYNVAKAGAPWPQQVTAWRSTTEPFGPYLLDELSRFPRSGWMRTDRLTM